MIVCCIHIYIRIHTPNIHILYSGKHELADIVPYMHSPQDWCPCWFTPCSEFVGSPDTCGRHDIYPTYSIQWLRRERFGAGVPRFPIYSPLNGEPRSYWESNHLIVYQLIFMYTTLSENGIPQHVKFVWWSTIYLDWHGRICGCGRDRTVGRTRLISLPWVYLSSGSDWHSYLKLPFIVSFPIQNGDFP